VNAGPYIGVSFSGGLTILVPVRSRRKLTVPKSNELSEDRWEKQTR